MLLREYFNEQITNYCVRKNISVQARTSKFSDYYYITSIQGKEGHTLKIRISNHPAWQKYEIPFLNFIYTKTRDFPSKHHICCALGAYIAKYKERNND